MNRQKAVQGQIAGRPIVTSITGKMLQRSAVNPSPVHEAPPIVQEVLRSPGHPLDIATRTFMEPRFDYDFSQVRVHTDAKAVESAQAVNALAYTVGRDLVFGAGTYQPTRDDGKRLIAHELTHVVQQHSAPFSGQPLTLSSSHDFQEQTAQQMENAISKPAGQGLSPPGFRASEMAIQRVRFGTDGPLTTSRRAIVNSAAEIAERLVTGAGGIYDFKRKWAAFWSTGPGKAMSPKPSLETYQAAVQNRIVHDMDTSSNKDVKQIFEEEQTLPLERQTGAVTKVNSQDTYLRGFAIDQGLDSVTSLLLHESLHGVGLSMGPMMLYEPWMHGFEADVGFPLMMGGADITSITQQRKGDTDVDVTIAYNLRRVGEESLPSQIEIQVVSPESGEVVYDERSGGSRQPAREVIPSRTGQGRWVWHARNPGVAAYNVRIRNMTATTLLASQQFTPNPRCVIGVSTMHCEDEK